MKLALLSLLIAATVAAGPPSFDVASVKVSQAPDAAVLFSGGMLDAASGRWRLPSVGGSVVMRNWTLSAFLAAAFDLGPGQLTGPDWLSADRFDIVAKTSAAATQADLRIMLQRLLADRFGLQVHHETKELPMFALVAARAERNCLRPQATSAPRYYSPRPPG